MNAEGDKHPSAYFTISEVSERLRIAPHVLRYWQTQFWQIAPRVGRGRRRYYVGDDITLIMGIRHLLHVSRMKIDGVKRAWPVTGRRMSGSLEPAPSPRTTATKG
jgi:hypothetical protein